MPPPIFIGAARVQAASLSPAKREVKREARKRGWGVRGNQTSLRCLVLSLVAWSFEVILDICPPLPPNIDTPLPTLTGVAKRRAPTDRRELSLYIGTLRTARAGVERATAPKILESTHTPQPTQTPTLYSISIIMGLCSDDFRVLSSLPLRPAQPTPCVRFT